MVRAGGVGITCCYEFEDVTGRPRVLTQISLPHRVAGEGLISTKGMVDLGVHSRIE